MKSYLPLIASLLLLSASCSSSVAEIEAQKITQSAEISDQETEPTASEINPKIKDNIAPEISVKVNSAENSGSGVIIAQSDNTYLVLTNNHVLRDGEKLTIDTHDGESYQATEVESAIASDDDLALLQFKSDQEYQTAIINAAATPQAEQTILAVGYSAETGELVKETGKIELVPDKTLKEGYSIGYTSNIVQGMSGGAILNTDGEVIGINGKSAFPIVNSGYDNEDGTKPSAEEIEQYRQLSWGLSINRLLAQVNQETITAYSLDPPETPDNIETPVLTGWLGELEAEAKQISVRIDSSSGANGSGVIIAKEGNTYTVLTADHVLCEKDDERQCIGYDYEITTPDGETYTLDANTVKAEAGVDLATFKFTSNESYQVAQLADYPIQNNNAVFVAGYPKLGANTPPQWQFSLGFGLDKEEGLLSVNVSSNSSDNENLATLSQSSLAGGYEMVYTSPTYGGMSGGAVLDKDGRVIGIHGQAEGETTVDSRGGASSKIQMGLSLGIPISTFMGLKARLGVGEILSVGSNAPAELNPREQEVLQAAILGTEISDSNATAKTWLERGNQLWRLQRHEEAAAAFDKAINLNEAEFNYLAHYGKGLTLRSLGKYELALASLAKATTSNSEFAPAFLNKSVVLRVLNRFDEALVAIDSAIAIEPRNANYYGQQAQVLSDLNRFNEELIAINRAIEISPRAAFYYNRGNFYVQQEEAELAFADYNQAIQINPNDALAYNNRGIIYADQGEIELAIADLNQAIEINPNDALAYNNRGNFYYEQGEIELAIADLNQAIEIDPDLAIAYNSRGNFYAQQEEAELAIADYNQAIEINPNDAQAYYNRGVVYAEQGEIELAIADYSQAIEINPKYAQAYYNRGVFYAEQGETKLAIADYSQAIKINPNLAQAYNNRGLIYQERGEIKLALADYNQAIKINPNLVQAYNNRGLLYKEQGEVELALTDFNQAIKINPNLAQAYYNRGVLYKEQGEVELALADFNQAIKINPKLAEAYGNLGLLYEQMGDIQAAISNSEKAQQLFVAQNNTVGAEKAASFLKTLEQTPTQTSANTSRTESIDPNDAQAYYDRAFKYHQQQEYDRALADYSKVIELDRSNEKAFINRGLVYQSLGKDEDAIADYNQAIQINPNNSASYRNRGVLYFEQEKYKLAELDWDEAIAVNPEDALAHYNRGLLYLELSDSSLAQTDLETARRLAVLQENTDLAKQTTTFLEQLSPDRIYVLLFNTGEGDEGIHTVEFGETNTILMFESSETAEDYAKELKLQNFPTPQIEFMSTTEVESFCQESGYICELVHTGSKIKPPKKNVERFR